MLRFSLYYINCFVDEWSLEELSSLIKVPPSALRRRISFWQNHGLITEIEPGVFALLEEESEKIQFEEMNITDADEEDLESAMASASDQREEELQVCEYTNIYFFYETNFMILKL